MASKDVFDAPHLYAKVLGAYTRLLEQTFQDRLLSEKDQKLLQRIHQRLEEISTLIDELRTNTE